VIGTTSVACHFSLSYHFPSFYSPLFSITSHNDLAFVHYSKQVPGHLLSTFDLSSTQFPSYNLHNPNYKPNFAPNCFSQHNSGSPPAIYIYVMCTAFSSFKRPASVHATFLKLSQTKYIFSFIKYSVVFVREKICKGGSL
jgi:hypothetical protein